MRQVSGSAVTGLCGPLPRLARGPAARGFSLLSQLILSIREGPRSARQEAGAAQRSREAPRCSWGFSKSACCCTGGRGAAGWLALAATGAMLPQRGQPAGERQENAEGAEQAGGGGCALLPPPPLNTVEKQQQLFRLEQGPSPRPIETGPSAPPVTLGCPLQKARWGLQGAVLAWQVHPEEQAQGCPQGQNLPCLPVLCVGASRAT